MSGTSKPNPAVTVGKVTFANDRPIAVFAGPCQMESRAHALEMASALKEIAGRLGIGLVYKTSFDKANRTSLTGKRGVGLEGALAVFAEIREKPGSAGRHRRARSRAMRARRRGGRRAADPGLPVPPDRPAGGGGEDRPGGQGQEGPVPGALGHEERRRQDHRERQRQRAGHRARRLVRLQHAGGRHARAADHGEIGCPVIFDATHAVQQPGGQGTASGGERRFVPVLARAAVAVGVAGVFIETHQDPDRAPSDGPNMVPLKEFEALLRDLMAIDNVAKSSTLAGSGGISIRCRFVTLLRG